MTEPLKDHEIDRLRQLICDHSSVETYSSWGGKPTSCTCCGKYNYKCNDCNLVLDHECCEHDPYCNNCS